METLTEFNQFLAGENKPTFNIELAPTTILMLAVAVLVTAVLVSVIVKAIAKG